MNSLENTRIITFMGPVGVGKSTQIGLLENRLREEKNRVSRVYLKSSHGLVYFLSKVLVELGASEDLVSADGLVRTWPRPAVVKRLYSLWRFLDAISLTTKFLSFVWFPFRIGYSILIEEGLFMTMQTYTTVFPRIYKAGSKLPPFTYYLLEWINRNKGVYMILDAGDNELDLRRKSRNFRQCEVEEFVILQRIWFKTLKTARVFHIDTTGRSAVEVHDSVLQALRKFSLTKIPSSSEKGLRI